MYERLLKKLGGEYSGFKILKNFNFKFRIPKEFLTKCDVNEFCTPTPGKLPFFIGSQFGINPALDNQQLAMLEGQKVVMLSKSLLSGYEHCMDLMVITNGKFKSILKIERDKFD